MPTLAVSATVLAALLLPLLLAALARERALRGSDVVEARWFSFARRMHTLAQLAPITWLLAAMHAVPRTPFLSTFLRTADPAAAIVVLVAILAPLALLPAGLNLIANQVARSLGTTEISREETLRRGGWLVAAAVVPAALLGLGAVAMVRGNGLSGITLFALAAVIAIACFARSRKGLGLTPHSVTHGALRDRLFALAERAGVKLQQLYVLPMRRVRLANAFAVSGQVVMVTDLLLDRLDRHEVDAILAHEIAHLKRGDPIKLALANLAAGIVPFLLLQSLGWVWIAVGGCLGLLAATAFSRRIERDTDRAALRLGSHPASFITGLARLARLSHLPLRWNRWTGWWVTHPSVADRAHAVGREAGIDAAEVERLLAGAVVSGGPQVTNASREHYEVPANLDTGGRLFSTPFKNATLLRNVSLLLLVAVLVPGAVFAAARALGAGADMRVACFLIALLCGPAATLLVFDFLAVQPLHGLRRPLARRLGLGERPEADGWLFAGLAPHAEPRIYEGFSNWELGFVRLRGDGLEFAGEEMCFALPAERVVDTGVAIGTPSWIPTRAVLVDWLDDAGDEHSLRLMPVEGAALHAVGAAADRLGAAIGEWRSKPCGRGRSLALSTSAGAAAPAGTVGEPRLSLPPSGNVTCAHPRTLARPGNLVPFAVLDVLVAGVFCLMLGLPLFPLEGPGFLEMVCLALATQVFLLVPGWRYRDSRDREGAASATADRRAA